MKRSFVDDLRRGLGYLRPHHRRIAVVVALTLGAGTLPALEPLVQKTIFDRLADVPRAAVEVRALLGPLAILVALLVARVALEGVATVAAWRVRLRVNADLLADTTARLHSLPLAYHQGRGVGDTMTRLDRGITSFMEGLASVAFQMIPAVVFLLVSVGIMVRLSPPLALVACAFLLPPLVLGRSTTTHLVERERLVLDQWCRIYNRFQQVLSGIKTVKAFAQEADEHARFLAEVQGTQTEVLRTVGIQARLAASRNVFINVGRVAVLGVGAVLVARGQIGVGTLVAFLGYVGALYGPAQTLLGLYETARRAELGLEAIFGVLDAEDAVPDALEPHVPARIDGHIELDAVTFRHHAGARPAIDHFSVRIAAGEFVAVVGPSGAGKTTLADLILRLHDPTEGAVRIDGRDVRSLCQRGLRRHIGIVTQEAFLFEDTLLANLRYGSPGATMDEVRAAARAAQLEALIEGLADGYSTLVGRGGVQLSGGERQRVAIARTLLRDPRIVILDEPTSSLDVEGEAAIHRAILELCAGRTTLMIAHRLATTAGADRVLVIDGGRLVEEGPPGRLLGQDGAYRRMMALAQALAERRSTPRLTPILA